MINIIDTPEAFGKLMKRIMTEKNVSVMKMAKETTLHRTTIVRVLNGNNPSMETARIMCDYLGCGFAVMEDE